MRSLVVETERAWQALGRISYGPTESEKALHEIPAFSIHRQRHEGRRCPYQEKISVW